MRGLRPTIVLGLLVGALALFPALHASATGARAGEDELQFCKAQIERLQQALRGDVDLNARARAEDELDEALEAAGENEVSDCLDALEEAFEAIGLSLRGPEPRAVRLAARAMGIESLSKVAVPVPQNLGEFIRPGLERQAVQLGKALFWDAQAGSDGKSCGSCHFAAGADPRIKNQLNPGLRANDKGFGLTITAEGRAEGLRDPGFGPNYVLNAADFPLRLLADQEEPNYNKRILLRDTNDVVSSQGVLRWRFDGITPGAARDAGTPLPDEVFHVGGINVRRVEPRNTPTMINSVFNHENFWDGRAQADFNGVNPFGALDDDAKILVVQDGAVTERRVLIPFSSLASQAVGPPTNIDEMSYEARLFPDVGKKLLAMRPLDTQEVHPQDSVLGSLSRAVLGQTGLTTPTYADLVRAVFLPQYWNSARVVTFEGDRRTVRDAADVAPGAKSYNLMEANFALFFGLAIQMYESTLVADATPFDRFMEGDDKALQPDQLVGLLTFINRGTPEQKADPLFKGVRTGNCVACHAGPELTLAGTTSMKAGIARTDVPARLQDGRLVVGERGVLHLDKGFSNIGVRPTAEDVGRGGKEAGKFLSRQPLLGQPAAPGPEPQRVGVDGAFKIPGLRNVELTGPYFHNGGQATLKQVVEFYDRFADFADINIRELDPEMARVDLEEDDEVFVTKFLVALTDERVRNEQAPFDRPQLFVPTGQVGDHTNIPCNAGLLPCEDRIEVPAVGAGGRMAKGLLPLPPFLGIAQVRPEPEEEDEEDEEDED